MVLDHGAAVKRVAGDYRVSPRRLTSCMSAGDRLDRAPNTAPPRSTGAGTRNFHALAGPHDSASRGARGSDALGVRARAATPRTAISTMRRSAALCVVLAAAVGCSPPRPPSSAPSRASSAEPATARTPSPVQPRVAVEVSSAPRPPATASPQKRNVAAHLIPIPAWMLDLSEYRGPVRFVDATDALSPLIAVPTARRPHVRGDGLALADRAFDQGDFVDALSQYKLILERVPSDGRLYVQIRIAHCYVGLDRVDDAIALLNGPAQTNTHRRGLDGFDAVVRRINALLSRRTR